MRTERVGFLMHGRGNRRVCRRKRDPVVDVVGRRMMLSILMYKVSKQKREERVRG